jgi:hypothetical protein
MIFDEAMQVWAKRQFALYRYPFKEDDTFEVDSTIIYGGGCETCSYEIVGYRVRNNRTHKTLEIEVDFSALMRTLQRISEE